MPLDELANRRGRIQADRLRVGANVRPAEDTERPVREVVALQRLEQREFDFGLVGNRRERDLSPFALQPEPISER